MSRVFFWRLVIAAGILAPCAVAASDLEKLVDKTAERVRKEFNVPGISVAVVKDGKVALAKGYRVRKLGASDPMTAETLVGIGSNTKAFTSAALALLVDEKKLNWD